VLGSRSTILQPWPNPRIKPGHKPEKFADKNMLE